MTDQVDEHIHEIEKIILENDLGDKPGSVLYSGYETIQKGDWYFLGQNPGGHADAIGDGDKIIKQVNRPNKSFNEYFEGQWVSGSKAYEPGEHIHQRRIKELFSALDVNLKEVCSTNLSFVRSRKTDVYQGSLTDDFELCWNVHRYLLSIVRPRNILCNGAEARNFILNKMDGVQGELHQEKEVKKKQKCKFDIGNIVVSNNQEPLKNVRLFSVPHLSRFSFYPESAKWIRSLIDDSASKSHELKEIDAFPHPRSGISIKEAKKLLSIYHGVDVDNIEITIKG